VLGSLAGSLAGSIAGSFIASFIGGYRTTVLTTPDTHLELPRMNESPRISAAYGPESEAWRLNREATILLGAGPRALLLQVAHPLIAEGVEQHSDFRRDPWARLRATLRSYLAIVYGSGAGARAEIARLNRLHRRIVGPVLDPAATATTGAAAYSGRDPELALWVHATLIDSTIVAHDAWIEPLSGARRAAFYDETRAVGRAFGIPDAILPADYPAFEAYLARMLGPDGPVHPTPTARSLAAAILEPPLAPLLGPAFAYVPAATYAWTLWPALALLPPKLRDEFGIPWGPNRRVVAAWLTLGYRAWRPILPPTWRQMPQALAADRRVAALAADRRVAAAVEDALRLA
jgi:uncharacterized protein (DUF2236 family)